MSEAKELNVKDVLEAKAALEALIRGDKEDKLVLASSVRIKLAGNIRKTRPVNEDYNETRTGNIQKLGEEVKDKPGTFRVKPENLKAFLDQDKDALATKTDVIFQTITEAELFGDLEADAKDQNQVDIDVIDVLKECGILK